MSMGRRAGEIARQGPGAEREVAASEAGLTPRGETRALIVARSRGERDRLASELRGWRIERASSARAAREIVERGGVDLVLIEIGGEGGAGLALARELGGRADGPAIVLVARDATIDAAVSAMRDGADDVIDARVIGGELIARCERAMARARRRSSAEDERRRLRGLCRRLDGVRQEMFEQVGSLCDDLVSAYGELSDQIDELDVLHEFQSMVRRELDVESLLRMMLEYVLSKGGSTNAAIFLPDTSGEYSLGAYVNYDCPKDSGEAMLDLLADVIPERFCEERAVVVMRSEAEIEHRLGDEAHWLSGQGVVALSCFADGECLAVVALFRDRRQPFEARFLRTLAIIREVFARQLARVIRVHHRLESGGDPGGGFGGGHGGDPGLDGLDLAA